MQTFWPCVGESGVRQLKANRTDRSSPSQSEQGTVHVLQLHPTASDSLQPPQPPTGTASSEESHSKATGDVSQCTLKPTRGCSPWGALRLVPPPRSGTEVGKHSRARFCLQEVQQGILPLPSVQTNSAPHQNNQLSGI